MSPCPPQTRTANLGNIRPLQTRGQSAVCDYDTMPARLLTSAVLCQCSSLGADAILSGCTCTRSGEAHVPDRAHFEPHVDASHRCVPCIRTRGSPLRSSTAELTLCDGHHIGWHQTHRSVHIRSSQQIRHIPFCWRAHPPVCRRLWLSVKGHLALGLCKEGERVSGRVIELRVRRILNAHAAVIRRRWRKEVRVLQGNGNIVRSNDARAERSPDCLRNLCRVLVPQRAVRLVAGVRYRRRGLCRRGRGRRRTAARHHRAHDRGRHNARGRRRSGSRGGGPSEEDGAEDSLEGEHCEASRR